MSKPKIQLSFGIRAENYINATIKLGALPISGYCPAPDLSCDGLILCGGSDVHPKYFGEDINGSEEIDIMRDEAELRLADAFIKAGKPVLGVCRGHQLLNIYFGGGLIQHLDTAANHSSGGSVDLVHSVKACDDSLVGRLYGCAFFVNSHHHQGLSKIGKGLRVTAVSEDGTVEAIEHKSLPVWGVQWHPERMCFENSRCDTVDGSLILGYFISKCAGGEENVDK